MRTPDQLVKHAEAQRRYRLTHPRPKAVYNAETHRVHARTYRHRHPERYAAQMTVYRAVRDGRLTRQPCVCGEIRVEAHHYLGYAKEHQLSVRWLCRPHHREAHG